VMVSMLKNAASFIANKFDVEVGGKTGTTNDYVDGWFVGISPELVIGTWVGGEYPWIRFRQAPYGYGSQMARPFYKDYMLRLENDPQIKLLVILFLPRYKLIEPGK